MLPLIVVDNPKKWPLKNPGALLVAARAYLTDPYYADLRGARVFNLSRSYRYQSIGYYVSLLAMARGHRPLPSIHTIQDMKSPAVVRLASEDHEDLIRRSLKPIQSDRFTLSVYFGRNLAKRYDELSTELFRRFQAPLLQAQFDRETEGWRLSGIRPIAASDIPDTHRDFVIAAAREFFDHRRTPRRRVAPLYDLAILHDPREESPPSNPRALKRLVEAGAQLRLDVELIEREDFGRLAEFDALFIRETTAVNHPTYRFSQRAVAEGLVVIDDPDSIIKCANKVYLAELLDRYRVPRPRTLIVHRDNREQVAEAVGLPCVLKQPDSSFSLGVTKVEDAAALPAALDPLLEESDLVIAQAFTPTPFDWRITVLDRQPLFACKYHMARDHWQIVQRSGRKHERWGRVEAVPWDGVPLKVVKTALRAARLIGDGLYGVDLKELDGRVCVIEINDNPNLDAGYEDRVLGPAIYERIMHVFLQRIQLRKRGDTKVRA